MPEAIPPPPVLKRWNYVFLSLFYQIARIGFQSSCFINIVSCPIAVWSHFWSGGGACESVGAKESTLVMNENGPFMLHGWPTFCRPIHNQRQIPVGRDTDTVVSLLSVGFVHLHL